MNIYNSLQVVIITTALFVFASDVVSIDDLLHFFVAPFIRVCPFLGTCHISSSKWKKKEKKRLMCTVYTNFLCERVLCVRVSRMPK